MPEYFYHVHLETFQQVPNPQSEDTRLRSTPLWSTAVEALRPFFAKQSDRQKRLSNSKIEPFPSASISRAGQQVEPVASAGATAFEDTPRSASFHESSYNTPPQTTGESRLLPQDKRLDQMSIESIDTVPLASGLQSEEAHEDQITRGIGSAISGQKTKGKYVPLDQRSSESAWGIVHLYRDADETPGLYDDATSSKHHKGRHGGQSKELSFLGSSTSDLDCTTLCILAVPSYLGPSDFLGFVGEETRDEVSHFRMIRTARANRYMVLMKFRSAKRAREWRKEWNGKVFNSMEPETCHVVFVKSVEIQDSSTSSTTTFPSMKNDPFTSTAPPTSSLGKAARPLAPRTPSLIELPTCPVCLERMDETTGLLTILCQHVFHCTCLQKWSGGGCPVCRYTHDDFSRGRSGGTGGLNGSYPDDLECETCHADENLWQCLICGKVGCGRYDAAHAFAHFEETGHSFAMDVASQRVWDYVGDNYVHRIIQNQSDGGKLVELPAREDPTALDPPDWTDSVPREKLENISLEYTHLLTSQLESQRVYFEEKASLAADKATSASAAAAAASEAAERASRELAELKSKYDDLAVASVPALEKEKSRAERKADKFEAMARKLEREWREEKTVTASLMQRIEHMGNEVETVRAENERLKAEKLDLEEQNRDLTFFISSSEKIKSMEGELGEEVKEGTVGVPEPASKGKRKGRRG